MPHAHLRLHNTGNLVRRWPWCLRRLEREQRQDRCHFLADLWLRWQLQPSRRPLILRIHSFIVSARRTADEHRLRSGCILRTPPTARMRGAWFATSALAAARVTWVSTYFAPPRALRTRRVADPRSLPVTRHEPVALPGARFPRHRRPQDLVALREQVLPALSVPSRGFKASLCFPRRLHPSFTGSVHHPSTSALSPHHQSRPA